MHTVVILMFALAAGGSTDYSRSLAAKELDQATLDVEGYGEKKAFKREDDGLRVTLAPGDKETGWKTPQQLRIGGDFTISANFVIKKLPKPAQEDGAAIGLAIAYQNIDQPDATLVRLVEPTGAEVFRSIESANNNAMMMQQQMQARQMMMMGMFQQQQPGKPQKSPRHTFPAAGETIRLEIQREGSTIRYQVLDGTQDRPRYVGQVATTPNDVAAVKLFVSNRNGAEAINVLLRDVTIRADRLTGLGTVVRSIFGDVVYADPSALENGVLQVGGPPKAPPAPPASKPEAGKAAAASKPGEKKDPASKPADADKKKDAPATPAAKPAEPPKEEVKASAVEVPAQAAQTVVVVGNAVPPAAILQVTELPPELSGLGQVPPPGLVMPAGGPQAPPTAPAQKPTEPKAKIPLDEVESIRFERTAVVAGRFMGQPNLDFTLPGLSAKKEEPAAKKEEAATKKAEPAAKKEEAATKKVEPAAKKEESATKKDEPAAMKEEAATKKVEPAAKKEETATKKDEPAAKKEEAATKTAELAAKKEETAQKADSKKPIVGDDVLAPPPGTAAPEKFAAVEAKPNGIRDLHIWLFNLRSAAIKQITVNCQTDKGPTGWRLDTVDSQDWPLVLRRSGNETSADLFLDPPGGDCHEKDFMINITYADGQAANVSVKAKEHTDSKRAIDPKSPATPPLDAWVYLTGEDRLFGKLERFNEESLRLLTPWSDHVDIPLTRIIGVRLGAPDRKESAESFARRLKTRGAEDVLLARTKDGEVVAIAGVAEGTEDDKLKFRYQEKTRTLPLALVDGLILAARPESKASDELESTFTMLSPVVVSGRWKDLDTAVWKVETGWGQTLNLPAAEVQAARFRGGKMSFLSDLRPSKVEETPYFGRRLPWRKDVNLLGEPLKINGLTYEHGIAVHSRCVLTYDLNGRYSEFETQVGFDDSAHGKGRVECRVFADGKEIYANPDLRGDGPPVKLALPVAGAEQLRLVIDFGQENDTGDRVIWANPRLFRKTNAKTAAVGGSSKP